MLNIPAQIKADAYLGSSAIPIHAQCPLDWSGAKEHGLRVAYLLVNSARSGQTTQLS